jgi:hypothetical protein
MSLSYDKTQIMLSHAFAAYVGSGNFSLLPDHKDEVDEAIRYALATWPALKQDGWDLVWGPACISLLPVSLFDINLMYLSQSRLNPHQFVLSIRGTNPFSLPNWLLEDFYVQKQSPWLFAPGVMQPKISQSTFNGLHALSSAATTRGDWFLGNAGAKPLTISEMIGVKLKTLIGKEMPPIELTITGHSLGGALAPTIGLWLADTQSSWDPERKVTLDVYAFAGPSPGNESFAEHFHDMFGERYHGIVNYHDIVTKGWALQSTRSITKTYLPDIKANIPTRLFFEALAFPLKKVRYQSLAPGPKSFSGKIFSPLDDFWGQAIYQHSVAYLTEFNLIPDHLSKKCTLELSWESVREAMARPR